ncbi:kinase-like domain-containing protein, partial [Phlebopus sp. FC_14]
LQRLIRELSVWHGLSHPNILPLYGITENFGPLYSMVCPWVASGTLTCYLKSYITMSQRIGLAYDVAAGLRYLHSKEFVHGDISGSNVLILASGEACLSDFGLSRTVTDLFGQSASSSRGYATVRWADPVLCQLEGPHVRPSNSTDIYSLGSITLQVLSAKLPFARYKRDSSVLVPMSKNEKPGRRDDFVHIDHHLWDFMERCWSTTTARPTAQEAEEGLWGQLAADDHRKLPGVRGTEVYLPCGSSPHFFIGFF